MERTPHKPASRAKMILSTLVSIIILVAIGFFVSKRSSSSTPAVSTDMFDVFKNATYTLVLTGSSSPQTFTMTDGSAMVNHAGCSIVNLTTKAVIAAALDAGTDQGVVSVYCNYGASLTDVYLVAFKGLNGTPDATAVQTSVVDVRKHPDLSHENLFRVGVSDMAFLPNDILRVNAMVVPKSLENAPGYEQSASELVMIGYKLGQNGALTPADVGLLPE